MYSNTFLRKRGLNSRCLYIQVDLNGLLLLLFLVSGNFICKDIPCKCTILTIKIAKSNEIRHLKMRCDLC